MQKIVVVVVAAAAAAAAGFKLCTPGPPIRVAGEVPSKYIG
jgi:hypothetical protein